MWEGPQCPDLMNDGNKKIAAPRQVPRAGQPHSGDLRLHRWADASATFFITKSLHPKKPVLDPEARAVIVSAFRFTVEHGRIYLRAFVVMPDHWHALFALREPWTLPKFMHDLMSCVARKTSRLLNDNDTAWQDGYYDTHVKTAKQFEYVAYYIEQNPVVKGLVDSPEQWDASSANCKDMVTDTWPLIYD
jgi:REP element-mobilizing transposase RayT